MSVTTKAIAILLHDFNAGGTEATAFRLAAAWIAQGHRVTIVAGAERGAMRDRVPAGADVRILSPEVPRSATSRLRLGAPMAAVLREATGKPWQISMADVPGAPTVFEAEQDVIQARHDAARANPIVAAALEHFPGAELIEPKPAKRSIT